MLVARRALPSEVRASHARAIAARVAALPSFAAARTVALYAPIGAEVDPGELALAAVAAGKQVVWPRLLPGRRDLSFAAAAPDELEPGPRGTRQPAAQAPEVPAGSIDLVLVPGVAFDGQGRRLGRGGGYYDATLPALAEGALRVGVAFDCQIAAAVPAEPHDAAVDLVATELRLLRAPRARAAG